MHVYSLKPNSLLVALYSYWSIPSCCRHKHYYSLESGYLIGVKCTTFNVCDVIGMVGSQVHYLKSHVYVKVVGLPFVVLCCSKTTLPLCLYFCALGQSHLNHHYIAYYDIEPFPHSCQHSHTQAKRSHQTSPQVTCSIRKRERGG